MNYKSFKYILQFTSILLLTSSGSMYGAASSSSSSPSSSSKLSVLDQLSAELLVWHNVLRMHNPDCTLEEACASLLKLEDVIRQEPRPILEAASSSSAKKPAEEPPQRDERFSKPLDFYITMLRDKQNTLKKIHLNFTIEKACAYLIRQYRLAEPLEQLQHTSASKSVLWPSLADEKLTIKVLDDWHQIYWDLSHKCSKTEACALILMHQRMLLNPLQPHLSFMVTCCKSLQDKMRLFSKVHKEIDPIEAYAYCIRYPLSTLSAAEKKAVKSKPSYVISYETLLRQEAEDHRNEPEYVGHYRKKLASMEKVTRGSYFIQGIPRMDPTWQKLVNLGYPSSLKTVLRRFQQCADSLEEISKKKRLYFLHGYPGGGKTSAALLLALILKRPLFVIRCPGVQSEYQSSAAKNIERMLLPILDSHDPWIICLDEIDALQKTTGSSEQASAAQSRSHALGFLQQLSDSARNHNMIIIGTSNFKADIPKSIMDRINIGAIEIPLPDYDARKSIAALLLDAANIEYHREILDIIAHETGGLLSSATSGLSSRCIEGIIHEMSEQLNDAKYTTTVFRPDGKPIATPEITKSAIKRMRTSIADGGQPTTCEGRWLEKAMSSPHFWPITNWITNLVCSGVGGAFQAIGESRARREERRSIEHLGIARSGESRAGREEIRSIRGLELNEIASHIQRIEVTGQLLNMISQGDASLRAQLKQLANYEKNFAQRALRRVIDTDGMLSEDQKASIDLVLSAYREACNKLMDQLAKRT